MIQFNLLPDVKVAYIKAKKAKRVVVVIAGIAVAVSLTLLIIMYSAVSLQKKHIKDLDKDIKNFESSLNHTEDLAKILTIQNQLNALNTKYNEDGTIAKLGLYDQRPVTSRLFKYIQATTPKEVSISKLNLKFEDSTLEVEGTADTLEFVNRYIDTLKFTKYTSDVVKEKTPAFTNVVLTKFNRDIKAASYTISFNFDPAIFDAVQKVTLDVPQTITTRSETELPGSTGVFDAEGTN